MNRKYHLSDGRLVNIALYIHTFMIRDSAYFAARGVDSDEIIAYKNKIDVFKILLSDDYYKAMISGYTDTKSDIRKTAMMMIQLISGYFEQKWGKEDSIYNLLRIEGLHAMKDNDFLVSCLNVVSVASDYLPYLLDIGLTQSDIDSLASETLIFEDLLNLIAHKRMIRESKRSERIQLGNELYLFVKKYSSLGKLIWENVNLSRYNNYLIYKNIGTMPSNNDEILSVDVVMASDNVEMASDNVEMA